MQDCPQKRRLPFCSEQWRTACLGSAGVSLLPEVLLSPQAAPQALCSVPKIMQRSSLQNLRTAQQLRTALNSEPVPAVSHIQLAKLSLNKLCCSVLNKLETFRVQQFELHPTKDVVKKHLYLPGILANTQVGKLFLVLLWVHVCTKSHTSSFLTSVDTGGKKAHKTKNHVLQQPCWCLYNDNGFLILSFQSSNI